MKGDNRSTRSGTHALGRASFGLVVREGVGPCCGFRAGDERQAFSVGQMKGVHGCTHTCLSACALLCRADAQAAAYTHSHTYTQNMRILHVHTQSLTWVSLP